MWRFRFIIYLKHGPIVLAIPVHHISQTRARMCRFRLIIHPSFGVSGSSYILNTSFHLAIPIHHIYLKHALSYGDSGLSYILNRFRAHSSYILNKPPHLKIRICISYTHCLIWRFRLIIYLKHAPSSGDSGSSYILDTPPHLAIPVHHNTGSGQIHYVS